MAYDLIVGRKPLEGEPEQRNPCVHDGPSGERLMCDNIAIAFQTDRTRVATLLQSRDLSAL